MEAGLRARLKALPPAARAELLHVLRLPDLDRVERFGELWGHPETREFGELLIDCEGKSGAPGRACRDAAGDGAEVVSVPQRQPSRSLESCLSLTL
jgi:hypothetical protein